VSRRFVAYYRIDDASDLQCQVECVKDHVRDEGGELARSYRDDEGRKRSERPELKKALAYVKQHGATLIIATLKGLSRDWRFLRLLRDSGIDFLACDLPFANASTINVLTALAEYEANHASERSKKAAAAYKARGGQLGAARPGARSLNPEARERGARNAGKIARASADLAYRELIPTIRSLRDSGLTLKEIADNLSANGHRTRRGRPWNAMQVSRVLRRDPLCDDAHAD
jgi:DNA invertase Pin-like site-specific DNA recombinase